MVTTIINAQNKSNIADVYVTTQDYANLRLGPGENWDIMATLDYDMTFRAVGRSHDGRWIQIMYHGDVNRPDATIEGITYGWVAYSLLVWTGDIYELPRDGVRTVTWARPAYSGRTAQYYSFPSGRIFIRLQRIVETNKLYWQTISQRWYDLEAGFQTTCNDIPPLAVIEANTFSTNNLTDEARFLPVIAALDGVVDNMNRAIHLLGDICNQNESDRFATPEDVMLAIEYIDQANRQLNLVQLFLVPLQEQHILLSN